MYRTALNEFSSAVLSLSKDQRIVPNEEYHRLRNERERARFSLDIARLSLQVHRREHGC
jgi:hypothetical protein